MRIVGTSWRDLLIGTSRFDQIYGLGGDDIILAERWGDQLYGGAGNDRLYADTGNETMWGGAGNDRMWGGVLQYGGVGDDQIRASSENDRAYGGAGNDLIYARAGDDRVYGQAGDDRLYGEADQDTLFGGAGNDLMDGGRGADYVAGDVGDDDLYGGAGNDRLYGGRGLDTLYGGAGDDTLDGGLGNDDSLYGGPGDDDTLYGGAGNDLFIDKNIYNSGGPLVSFNDGGRVGVSIDLLTGIATRGSETDRLIGITQIELTNGADSVVGVRDSVNMYDDLQYEIHGLDGDDTIIGWSYEDAIFGGNGDDVLWGGRQSTDYTFLSGDDGNDILRKASSAFGGRGDDRIESEGDQIRTSGDSGNDYISIVVANAGTANGGDGDDTIVDMTNYDPNGYISPLTLSGDAGRDVLEGGGTYNVFAFAEGDTVAGAARDIIRNFDQHLVTDVEYEDTWDVIDVSVIDANATLVGDQAFAFVGLTNAPGAGQLGYYLSGSDTIVIGNTGATRFEIELAGFSVALVADDFVL